MKALILPEGLSAAHHELKQIHALSNFIESHATAGMKKLSAEVIKLFSRNTNRGLNLLQMKVADRDAEGKMLPESGQTFLETIFTKAMYDSQDLKQSGKFFYINKEHFKNAGLDMEDDEGSYRSLESTCKFICEQTNDYITCGISKWHVADNPNYIQFWGRCSYTEKTLPVLETQS
jgi:hypothetical protein